MMQQMTSVHAEATFVPPSVLTPKAFHEALQGSVGLNTIYELLRAGRLRHAKIGNRYLILTSEVTEFFVREADYIAGALS